MHCIISTFTASTFPKNTTSSKSTNWHYTFAVYTIQLILIHCNNVISPSTSSLQAITSGEPGIVTSPYYPLPYPTNTKCSWLVRGGDSEQVQITILEFDLEHFTYCRLAQERVTNYFFFSCSSVVELTS